MEVPETLLTDCQRYISGCLDALQAADELDRMGLKEKAEFYRLRAPRQADFVRRLLGGTLEPASSPLPPLTNLAIEVLTRPRPF